MQNYNIKDYSVEFDRTATVDWYEKYEGWSCDCGDCQSFLAWVRQKQLPSAVTELLQIFGALPENRPMYVNYIQLSGGIFINSIIVWSAVC